MVDRGEPEIIDVELTSTEVTSTRSNAPDAAWAAPMSDSSTPAHGPDRSPIGVMLGIGAVGVLVGAIVGFALGRAADDAGESIQTNAESTTDGATSSTEPATVEVMPAVEPAAPTPAPDEEADSELVGDADETTETTDAPVFPVATTVSLAPPVDASAAEILLIANDGSILTLRAATGELSDAGHRITTSSGRLAAGPGWFATENQSTGGLRIFNDSGELINSVDGAMVTGFDGEEVYWESSADFSVSGPDSKVTWRGYNAFGEPTGATVTSDPFSQMLPLADGVALIDGPSGVFVQDADGAKRVSTGNVLAMGERVVFAQECDDVMRCPYVVIDRTDGTRQELTALDEDLRLFGSPWWSPESSINEPGTAAVVAVFSEVGPTLAVIDFEASELIDLDTDAWDAGTAWMPGGESMLWVRLDPATRLGELMVLDLATGESVPVSPDLPSIRSVAVRESLPSVDPAGS